MALGLLSLPIEWGSVVASTARVQYPSRYFTWWDITTVVGALFPFVVWYIVLVLSQAWKRNMAYIITVMMRCPSSLAMMHMGKNSAIYIFCIDDKVKNPIVATRLANYSHLGPIYYGGFEVNTQSDYSFARRSHMDAHQSRIDRVIIILSDITRWGM